ncbi:MAG TPA: peptidylprolyl isomerase [Pyrinomonadaceae bacterium]|nr:peptidylprolyl isomerase [Pyrinomonadaceae bacterium]
MNLKFIPASARAWAFVFAALLSVFSAAPAVSAQEEAPTTVVDEPIAQVNNDVIMLSHLRKQMRDFKEILVKQRGMTEQQADEELRKKQPEIIANLINEQLLMQRGKEIPRLSEEIEAEVNREVLRVANRSGIKSLDELEAEMNKENMSLAEIRQTLRTQYTRQAVLQREVDYKIYLSLTENELRKYYEANRDKFRSVTISEIFLSKAGRPEAEVRQKAAQLVAQARGGADFGALAAANSEREYEGVRVATKTKGRIEEEDGKLKWFILSELQPTFANAIKNLKAGEVSDVIPTDDGFVIIRVNDRDEAFKENQVRSEIVGARAEKERDAYMQTLRRDAYIQVAKDYREAVMPLLKLDAAPAADSKTTTTTAKNEKDKKSN